MIINKMLPRKLRGFTLTEAAIVLGIVGLILGAIWVAAASVYNNMRVSTTSNQLLQIVQSIRSINSTSTTIPGLAAGTGAGSGVFLVAQANGIPGDMITRNAAGAITGVRDVWNGDVEIESATSTIADDSFLITLNGVPQGACSDLIVRNTGQGRDSGLTQVGANGTNYNAFPVTMAQAVGACNVTAAAGNVVEFRFTLRN